MQVIDSYNGIGFYAIGADSAKSAISAATAKYYTDGVELASKNHVAYNYVNKSDFNNAMALSSISGLVQQSMMYSTWLSAMFYYKTDTSSKEEISAAFANITGSIGGAGGDYVPLNAVECKIGANTSAIDVSLAQGQNCYAEKYSLAQGYYSSAYSASLAVGYYNKAGGSQYYAASTIEGDLIPAHTEYFGYSFAVGNRNNAESASLAVGDSNSASTQSLALGESNTANNLCTTIGTNNKAYTGSVCFGSYNSAYNNSIACGVLNYANYYSQAFGQNLKANFYTNAGNVIIGTFAIGAYNKTSAAPFVIGNGTSDDNRKDLFVIDKDGNVSAQGQIYAEGGVLGASLDTLELAPDNESIEFVTSSHNVVNGGGEPEKYTVIKIKTSLLNKIYELYNLVSSNSGTSNWTLPQ